MLFSIKGLAFLFAKFNNTKKRESVALSFAVNAIRR